jgi:hypothetical protein
VLWQSDDNALDLTKSARVGEVGSPASSDPRLPKAQCCGRPIGRSDAERAGSTCNFNREWGFSYCRAE